MQPKIDELLKNLAFWDERISSLEDGIKKLKGKEDYLEAVHIYLEPINPEDFKNKKYYDISKVERLSMLDEWVHDNLISEKKYSEYLNRYLKLDKLKFENVDEYILKRHYYPEAVKILTGKLKRFNLDKWKKKRFKYVHERKTNLFLGDGRNLKFDFRNTLVSLFILKNDSNRYILAIGGGGGSYQRERYTLFTAVFYLLSKTKVIKHHLIKYNRFNEFEYVKTFNKPIVTIDLGSNYSLDEKLRKDIQKHSVDFNRVRQKVGLRDWYAISH